MQSDFSTEQAIIDAPLIYQGFAGWPSFSPDGTQIAFTAEADTDRCFICLVDIRAPHQLYPITLPNLGAKRPSWHPNGRKIAYNLDNETIWIYEIESGRSKLYLPESTRKATKLIHPCYAPDGKSILVASLHRGGLQREEVLYRLDPDAKKPIKQLTEYPHVCAGRPAVSPDDSHAVFAGHAGFFNQVENRLWKVYPDKSAFELEKGNSANCHGRCPAYSPDGNWIACVSTRPIHNPTEETPMSVWIIRSDGSEAYKLTDSSMLPTHMSWSPNQKLLAVTGAYGVQLIDLPEVFVLHNL